MHQADVFQLSVLVNAFQLAWETALTGVLYRPKKFGPAVCQELQQTYLKRHAHVEWSSMFYYQGRACETERFEGNDILFKL